MSDVNIITDAYETMSYQLTGSNPTTITITGQVPTNPTVQQLETLATTLDDLMKQMLGDLANAPVSGQLG